MNIELQDKLYTSTEVAEILGVSLRTLYRYMEDGKIASMKTASGRHRFTREQILDFLNADPVRKQMLSGQQQGVSSQPNAYGTQQNVQQTQQPGQFGYQQQYPQQMQNQQVPQQPVVNQQYTEPSVSPVTESQPTQNVQNNVGVDQSNYIQTQQPQATDPFAGYGNQKSGAESNEQVATKTGVGSGFDDDLLADWISDSSASSTSQESADQKTIEMEKETVSTDVFDPLTNQTTNYKYTQERVVETEMSADKDRFSSVQAGQVQQESVNVSPQPEPKIETMGASQMGATSTPQPLQKKQEVEQAPIERPGRIRYYKSEYTDLIELAKKIKEVAQVRDLEYAFTLDAGMSLHVFLVKPFTILHFYANPEDMNIWINELKLVPVNSEKEANIGILINTDIIFVPSKEIGGFRVVEDKVLLNELAEFNRPDLLTQFRQHLSKTQQQ